MTKTEESLWYKDAIIYELHVKAFRDSNGDGVGDMQGLLEKLDYLEDLGINTIWLLPFYPSPFKDDGYDIADYFQIHSAYGDIRTFKRLVREAHKRDLRVITELVINHTSDQHPWFQRARRSKPGSTYRDYYVWSDDPTKYSDARIIFTDFEPSNWTWDPVAKSYYWHRFYSHQPDLNYDNPRVQKEIFRIMDFWFKMGVDGFRLDAIPYLYQRENTNCENLPETHAFLKKLRKYVDDNHPNKTLLAEANMWPEEAARYFGDGDECHMNYHFPIMPRLFMAVRMEDRYPIIDIIDQTPTIPDNCQWAIFLRNHDELTLEMVTDEERDYMYKVFTKDPQSRINLGIRHRLASLLNNNRRKIELMNILLFSLPGTPVLYYGDEIGMGDNFYLGDRDGVRTPMQWNSNLNAGFSEANPHKLYLPLIIDPEYKYEAVNVETQQMNSSSLLWWMKRVMAVRQNFQAFGRGSITFLSPANPKILAYIREYQEETILVLINLSRFSQPAVLELDEYSGASVTEIFSQNQFPDITDEPYLFTLAPYGYFWFVLEKQDIPVYPEHEVLIGKLTDLANPKNRSLQKVLPDFFATRHWYSNPGRKIKKISVESHQSLEHRSRNHLLSIIRVDFDQGLPQHYFLPFEFVAGALPEDMESSGAMCKARMGDKSGWLRDSIHDPEFAKALRASFWSKNSSSRRAKLKVSHLQKSVNIDGLKDSNRPELFDLHPTNNSLILFPDKVLKIYRKVDPLENQEFEMLSYLNRHTDFEKVPRILSKLSYHDQKGSYTLGILEEHLDFQETGWDYLTDLTRSFFDRLLTYDRLDEVDFGELESVPNFQELSNHWQGLLGAELAERITMLGQRTGEMHLALASTALEGFEPEPFSLHYQRSLFSSLQTLTRSTFQVLGQKTKDLSEEVQSIAEDVLGYKARILEQFKAIYSRKVDALKIRNHGDFHLAHVLWTGKDFVVIDFEGEPLRSFSERRIKRSPLRDLAGMIRSFHYAIYTTYHNYQFSQIKERRLENWVELYYRLISRFYINSYLSLVEDQEFIPSNRKDFELLLRTFLLEKAIYELKFDLEKRPEWAIAPLQGIKYLVTRRN